MKRRVLSLVTVFTLLVILALVAVLIRIPTSIDYSGQIIEYSTVDSEISIKHDIAIEGIYYDNALGHDSFQGTFYISDIEGIGKNLNNVHFDFNPQYRYCPVFYNDYGEPIGSGIAQIFFKLFGLLQLINVGLYFLVKINIYGEKLNPLFFIIAAVCWLVGALALNRSWEQGKISRKNLMIVSLSILISAKYIWPTSVR